MSHALTSTFATFGLRGFITAFISLLLTTFLNALALDQSVKNPNETRKESGNQLPQSKWNGKSRADTRHHGLGGTAPFSVGLAKAPVFITCASILRTALSLRPPTGSTARNSHLRPPVSCTIQW